MRYLNENDIRTIGTDWEACADVIRETVISYYNNNVVQPVKPYLRFGDLKNRIIAMPAYVGGKTDTAGIKWIASFPENIKKGIPRASSLVVLNDSKTGQIISVINSTTLSVIRTVSVSSLIIRYFLKERGLKDMTIGIIGLGPIGVHHLEMCRVLYGSRISKITLFDMDEKRAVAAKGNEEKIHVCKTWQEAYMPADIVITCTVSSKTYIDQKPKEGSLLLNVSLRDYTTKVFDFVKNAIIVDNWDEVCRENTDIEVFHKEKGLEKEHVKSISDIVVNDCLKSYPTTQPIMFNPMGMAIFDISIAKHYLEIATEKSIGLDLI